MTVMVQLPPAGTLDPQLFDWLKSPTVPILEIVSAPVCLLFSVTASPLLSVPTPWFPKDKLRGDNITPGHDGNLKDAIRVLQSRNPLTLKY